jgi:hypothetical protein
MPRCAMRHDLGKSWDREEAERAGKDFRSYDISWLPARDGEDMAYEMYVEFGLGMYLRKKVLSKANTARKLLKKVYRNNGSCLRSLPFFEIKS